MATTARGTPLTPKERIQRRWAALTNERQSWIDHYRDCSDYVQPRRGRFLVTDRNKGSKRNQKIQDESPLHALRIFSAGLTAGLTSPRAPWFRLTVTDPALAELPAVKGWLYDTERRMRAAFAKGNLYTVLPTLYQDLGLFGTGAMLILEDPQDVVRFYTVTAGSYCIAQNQRCQVDTLYRDCSMTVDQLVERFGYEKVSVRTKGLFDNRQLDVWIECLHAIEPRRSYDPRDRSNKAMPWASVYLELGADGNHILLEEGFEESPIAAPRWETTNEDIYGTSPVMQVLGSAKELMLSQKDKGKAIAKLVDPPLIADASMRNEVISLFPGAVNYADTSNARRGLAPMYEINPRIDWLLENVRDIRARIDRGLYVDLFLMIAHSQDLEKTATEVAALREEKLLMLGPNLERLYSEFLNPIIDRTYAVMDRRGEIAPPPPELGNVQLKVEYISVLATAQAMVGAPAIERLLGFVLPIAQVKPEVWDKIDLDDVVDKYAEMVGVPPTNIVPDDEVKKARAEVAGQARIAAAAELAPGAAKAAKDLADARPDSSNVLGRMLGGAGVGPAAAGARAPTAPPS